MLAQSGARIQLSRYAELERESILLEIIRASRYAGFCGGVKRAWKLAVQEAGAGNGPVYISGKLIHNTPAMSELASMGVQELDVFDTPGVEPGTPFLLRAHGEGPAVYEKANELGLRLIDGTCGIVRNVQRRARELEGQGFQVVLFGHRNHPEARATVAHTERGVIIESADEANALPFYPKIAAIAQTTSSSREYVEVCRVLRGRCEEFEDQGHICDFTQRSQAEAAELAGRVDAMVVVGGRDSSNTRRLVEVCTERCPTYHVETAAELQGEWFTGIARVGVTAGASTRDHDIDAVIARLRVMSDES
jgi:(E)-4-hydroxy-3-methyl-but-2-enyl pyrophosphate reductase